MLKPVESLRRAAGYVRVSQVGGREGDSFLSPEVQREKIEAWASFRGWTVTAWYVDLDVSGTGKVRRPEFERMMQDARDGAFEAIAVYRLTRFARSMAGAASAYSELERLGVGLVSVTEDIDTTTVAGNFMRNILFAMAEFESQRIGEEWRNVHASRRRRGIAHVPGGMFGFQVEGAVITGIEDAEARAVRQIFNMRAEGRGTGEIYHWLQAEGYRSRQNLLVSRNMVRKMLENPLYAGHVRSSDGELIPGVHEAVVPLELWERVQHLGARTRRLSRTSRGGLLSGLLVCASCGRRLHYGGHRYTCQSRATGRECEAPVHIAAASLEAWVEGLYVGRLRQKKLPNNGKLRPSRQRAAWRQKVTRLRSRSHELTVALDRLAGERYLKGTLEEAEYKRLFQRYVSERAECDQEADELESMAERVRPLDQNALSLWPSLPLAERRRHLAVSIDQVTVRPSPEGRARPHPSDRAEIAWIH